MGKICYVCKKVFKWHMLKFDLEGLTGKKIPPVGFSSGDILCSKCWDNLEDVNSPENLKRIEEERKRSEEQKRREEQGIRKGGCYWCRNIYESNEFCFKEEWILADHPQCVNCNRIIAGFISDEIERLEEVKSMLSQKYSILVKLEREATYGEFKANWQKYSDMLNGVANAGIAGGILPNSDTQFLKNSATETKASVEMQMIDIKNQMESIERQLKNEKVIFAKKHFFGDNATNSSNDTNNIKSKSNEDEPLKVLKNRLVKGEITIEEYKKIKEALD